MNAQQGISPIIPADAAAEAAVVLANVCYTYPGTAQPALDNCSLTLPAGEFVIVTGASGSGKSTLLRCLNGLVPHFSGGVLSGAVRVFGLDPVVATPRTMSRHVGFVFQDPETQFVVDRVEDEIAFALENAGLAQQEMRVRVEETLDLLDLAPLRNRALSTLSGGEKQRVAIAAALALRPRLLVLDEPTSQLDPKSAEDVLNALVRLNHDLGLMVILAEHRLERVLAYADRLVWLRGGGETPLSDTPRRVLEQTDGGPPLVQVGRRLGWSPLPLTIKDGLRFSRAMAIPPSPVLPARASSSGRTAQDKSREASPAPLLLEDVHCACGGKPVLRGVSLRVAAGEAVALMGRNGAGKTTLLKTLVGLVRPTRGRVLVAGRDTVGRETADICRTVAYLPQDPNALLFADTVVDELAVTLRNHGLPDDSPRVRQEMLQLLDMLRLGGKANAFPRDLSVGERQRVALAAVTITRPAALLLDEPTRGLDADAKALLVELLHKWKAQGAALLVVTHDVEFAAALADRVALMSQGEVIADGDPAQVLAGSQLFATQVARLFPNTGWLTAAQALAGLGVQAG